MGRYASKFVITSWRSGGSLKRTFVMEVIVDLLARGEYFRALEAYAPGLLDDCLDVLSELQSPVLSEHPDPESQTSFLEKCQSVMDRLSEISSTSSDPAASPVTTLVEECMRACLHQAEAEIDGKQMSNPALAPVIEHRVRGLMAVQGIGAVGLSASGTNAKSAIEKHAFVSAKRTQRNLAQPERRNRSCTDAASLETTEKTPKGTGPVHGAREANVEAPPEKPKTNSAKAARRLSTLNDIGVDAFSPEEVANISGSSKSSLYRARINGGGPPFIKRKGVRRIFYPRAGLEAYFQLSKPLGDTR